MTSRSAEATIKGYYYQFDTTILRLLDLRDTADVVTVEGIEDIDIFTATESTAIQCKYLSMPKFTKSCVRKPITLMLDHFVVNQELGLVYVLYAHFENETGGTERVIELQELKDILTYREQKVLKSHHLDHGIPETVLIDFLSRFQMVFGVKFEDQQASVIGKLKSHFRCSDFEADAFYYNNGLRKIIDISINKSAKKRRLSKGQFIASIDTARYIYNEWYIRLRSKDAFLKQVSKTIVDVKAKLPSKTRHIIIGNEILNTDDSEMNFITFVENIIHGYYRMGYALRDAKPITFILDMDQKQLNDIKKQLIHYEILFNDGYENLAFSATLFDIPPIVNVTTSKTKISKSSYHIRIISLQTLVSSFDSIAKPKVVMNFSKNQSPYEKLGAYSLFDIKHCETLKDISTLIL